MTGLTGASQLFNVVSQKDNTANREMSVWTKNISVNSQKDTVALKTLAMVTMLFLPGSFIAALFSSSFFLAWDDADNSRTGSTGLKIMPQFGIYWVVTIPITLVVFILYFVWLWWEHRQRTKKETYLRISDKSMTDGMVSDTSRTRFSEKTLVQA